jgi:hypothetical protein
MRLVVLFISFVFVGFAFGHNLEANLSVSGAQETTEGTIYRFNVRVKNRAPNDGFRNGIAIRFPSNEWRQPYRAQTRPHGIIGPSGRIPYLANSRNLVLVNDSDVYMQH